MSNPKNENEKKAYIKSKESQEIIGAVYSLLKKAGDINYIDITADVIRKVSNIKHPEALTTVLQPAVMAGLNKVNFSLLKDIPLVGELGELVKNSSTTLGHFVGVVDNISTGANYVSAWIGMGECRKKQERLIELREELKSITDPKI